MLTPWEIKRKEYMPPLIMTQLNIRGLFSLAKVALLNLGMLRSMREQAAATPYVRPTRAYTIPIYKKGMKSCDSEEKYLRPTLFCNCRAPEIIAMAHELGAYKKSEYEFAEAAFEFVKRKIILEMIPLDDVVPVLKRGTGTCIHEISLFIALCRAAGIKARYKFYALTMLEQWLQPAMDRAPLMKKWYDAMGFFMMHGEGEVYIDGEWIPADVGPTPERQASSGIPITKLGEDSIGIWLFPIPGTVISRESIPLGLGLPSSVLMKRVVPTQIAGINVGILEQIEHGKQVIKETGGEEKYDAMARRKRRKSQPSIDLKKGHDKIVFKE
jgi:hypothetical protein